MEGGNQGPISGQSFFQANLEMAEQAVALAKPLLQMVHRVDAHRLQRTVQEHRAVKARGVVTDLGDDVGVAQHHQGRVRLRAGGEAARMAFVSALAEEDLDVLTEARGPGAVTVWFTHASAAIPSITAPSTGAPPASAPWPPTPGAGPSATSASA